MYELPKVYNISDLLLPKYLFQEDSLEKLSKELRTQQIEIQKLNEDILRFITVKTEEISKEPSVMLKSSEKKDVY